MKDRLTLAAFYVALAWAALHLVGCVSEEATGATFSFDNYCSEIGANIHWRKSERIIVPYRGRITWHHPDMPAEAVGCADGTYEYAPIIWTTDKSVRT